MTHAEEDAWRDRFAGVPFEDKGGSHPSRYYQDIAIDRVLQAIAAGKPRILLTLATGTGKTFIAFQIAWKLFHSRWNRSGKPTRRPRILFLARISHKPSAATCGRQAGTALGLNRGSDGMHPYSPPPIPRPPCPSLPRAASRNEVCEICGL
jgi:hypothetical protein